MEKNGMKVAIIGGARIPFARANSDYKNSDNRELMNAALKPLVNKFKLEGKKIGKVTVGAVAKSSRDFSLARECSIDSGLSYDTPTCDIQMACGTSLEAAVHVGSQIALGQIDTGIAGGVDSSSVVPIELKQSFANRLIQLSRAKSLGEKLSIIKGFGPKELVPSFPAIKEPRTGLSMGEHCELMVKEWKIGREAQDELAFKSHLNAAKAYQEGFYNDLVYPYLGLTKDNTVRADTTIEKLNKLRPSFDKKEGTLTAGNSSPMTDGASSVLFSSVEYAQKNNLEIQSYFSHYQSSAVDYKNKEGLLMAPAYAIATLLERTNLKLQDFDFYEIHEAFAGQVLCTLKAFTDVNYCKNRLGQSQALGEIDMSKLNVGGGSLAIGHPFAATGTRIIASLSKMIHKKGKGRGLISICAAGGLGVTAIIEL